MSETEDKYVDFVKVINKLYDTAIAIRNENHDNPNNKTIFSSIDKEWLRLMRCTLPIY